MKNKRNLIILLIGLITFFFIWMYIQRVNFDYNTESKFFSPENGVVYQEQAKDVYGILALIGLILTGVLIYKRKT
ncbi:hypothetical protein [uncultured Aquimarina sp.]|uniref:hypothetical protein n=1 Tax=uncultured Aquimarina sp. TaxID=575652 RepID=UPI0026194B77|nr:hypothetical protein [uncultured Aquimarina sp.]